MGADAGGVADAAVMVAASLPKHRGKDKAPSTLSNVDLTTAARDRASNITQVVRTVDRRTAALGRTVGRTAVL